MAYLKLTWKSEGVGVSSRTTLQWKQLWGLPIPNTIGILPNSALPGPNETARGGPACLGGGRWLPFSAENYYRNLLWMWDSIPTYLKIGRLSHTSELGIGRYVLFLCLSSSNYFIQKAKGRSMPHFHTLTEALAVCFPEFDPTVLGTVPHMSPKNGKRAFM